MPPQNASISSWIFASSTGSTESSSSSREVVCGGDNEVKREATVREVKRELKREPQPSTDDTKKTGSQKQTKESSKLKDGIKAPTFPYGKPITLIALFFAVLAFSLSISSSRSLSFVKLKSPLERGNPYDPVSTVGLNRVTVCYDSEQKDDDNDARKDTSTIVPGQKTTYYEKIFKREKNPKENGNKTCTILLLEFKYLKDVTWDLSRVFGALAVLLGGTALIFVAAMAFVDTVNVVALCVTALFAYLGESLTFLIFGSDMCHTLGCSLGPGGVMSVIACISWFIVSVAMLRIYIVMHDPDKLKCASYVRKIYEC